MRNRTSNLRIPRSDALPLSHRDSAVSEAYYEVTGPPQITDGGSPPGAGKAGRTSRTSMEENAWRLRLDPRTRFEIEPCV